MTPTISKTALVVEDTPANLDFLERLLTHAGFQVSGTGRGSSALELADASGDLQLAVVDMELPDMTGLELIAQLRERFPDACLIIATMHDEHNLMESAFANGCNAFLVKPYGFMELFKRLSTCCNMQDFFTDPMVIDQYGPRPFEMAYT